MASYHNSSYGPGDAVCWTLAGIVVLALTGYASASATARRTTVGTNVQSPATATSLVFDGVTVVDVEYGKLLPAQRVIVAGNRIQAMGSVGAVKLPSGAQVVDARGKYLIPGLWDMHVHMVGSPFDQLFIANGVAGARQASSAYSGISPEDVVRRRQEIATGGRVGPREVFSGGSYSDSDCTREGSDWDECLAKVRSWFDNDVGFDMVKTYNLTPDMYFAVAAEARRRGKLLGGHVARHSGMEVHVPDGLEEVSAIEASDSGAVIIDHIRSSGGLDTLCLERQASVEQCQPVAERLRQNGTWWVPTLILQFSFSDLLKQSPPATRQVIRRMREATRKFWSDSLPNGNWLRGAVSVSPPDSSIFPHRTARRCATSGRERRGTMVHRKFRNDPGLCAPRGVGGLRGGGSDSTGRVAERDNQSGESAAAH